MRCTADSVGVVGSVSAPGSACEPDAIASGASDTRCAEAAPDALCVEVDEAPECATADERLSSSESSELCFDWWRYTEAAAAPAVEDTTTAALAVGVVYTGAGA